MTMRDTMRQFLDRPLVTNTILGVTLFDAVLMGIETLDAVMVQVDP